MLRKQQRGTAACTESKQFGTGSIMKQGKELKRLSVETIPTGSIALDLALGVGVFLRGELWRFMAPGGRKNYTAFILLLSLRKEVEWQLLLMQNITLDPQRAQN